MEPHLHRILFASHVRRDRTPCIYVRELVHRSTHVHSEREQHSTALHVMRARCRRVA